MDSLDKRPKQRNMDKRFELWNVKSLYKAGTLITVLKELARYRLDLVGVQEVRWEGGGLNLGENTHCSIERGMRIMNWVQVFLCIRESYKHLRGLSLLVTECHT
jgi:hypothetical protein